MAALSTETDKHQGPFTSNTGSAQELFNDNTQSPTMSAGAIYLIGLLLLLEIDTIYYFLPLRVFRTSATGRGLGFSLGLPTET